MDLKTRDHGYYPSTDTASFKKGWIKKVIVMGEIIIKTVIIMIMVSLKHSSTSIYFKITTNHAT